jgi:serralysin
MDLSGTPGGEAIDGSADPDEIDGDDGDDQLYGHGGADTLHGDGGNDTLDGGAGDDTLEGGSGKDVITGGEGRDTIVFRDGFDHDVVTDFDPAQDRVRVASSGVEDWKGVQARLSTAPDGSAILKLDDGSTLLFQGISPKELGAQHFDIAPPPVCFAAGTWIETPDGARRVEDLRPGDPVLTLDHWPQPVLWTGRRWTAFGHGAHRHQPMVIAPEAMGQGLPFAPLRVSPQHRLLLAGSGQGAQSGGVLAKAKALDGRPGVAQDRACTAADYLQLLLPRHAIVFANGLAAESLYPGPIALHSLGEAAFQLFESLFPGISVDVLAAYGPMARPVLGLRAVQALPPDQVISPLCGRTRGAAA